MAGSYGRESYQWIVQVRRVSHESLQSKYLLTQSIVKKGNHPRFRTLVELFRNFTLRKILNSLSDETGIIPRLGLTIVAL